MSRSVTVLGHLGKDAERKFTAPGVPVTTFSAATEHTWKDNSSGERKKATDWHNIVEYSPEFTQKRLILLSENGLIILLGNIARANVLAISHGAAT